LIGNTVIKSPQKSSVIQKSQKYKLVNPKLEPVDNKNNTTINRIKEEPEYDEQNIPSTSGSGMKIITHIPRCVLHARHPGLCMMKFQTITISRL